MAASIQENVTPVRCQDIGEFQESLRRMRLIDDRISNALNRTIPTKSFKGQMDATENCKHLYEMMKTSYNQREAAIKKCINEVSAANEDLRKAKEKEPDNIDILLKLRKQQNKIRLMQNELNIEEIVRDRSTKLFYERCRNVYKPEDLPAL